MYLHYFSLKYVEYVKRPTVPTTSCVLQQRFFCPAEKIATLFNIISPTVLTQKKKSYQQRRIYLPIKQTNLSNKAHNFRYTILKANETSQERSRSAR